MTTWRASNSARAMRSIYRQSANRPVELVVSWLAALLVAGFAIGITLVVMAVARAHGPAEWIQRGGFKNLAGELCCCEHDCFELSDSDVRITAAGYFIVSIKEPVPFSDATPSPDGRYWRCAWGGQRKCFFAPPGSS